MLFEVLIVIAIIALISGGIGLAVFRHGEQAKIRLTRTHAETVRTATKLHLLESRGDCPTFEQLLAAEVLEDNCPRHDPWGNSWRIRCEGTKVSVATNGPDREPETDDDIRVPQP